VEDVCRSPLPPRRPPHDTAEHDHLQHRQHCRCVDVAELRCTACDFDFEGRVRCTAEHADDSERGEREQEHHRGSGPQRRSQERKHDMAKHLTRRRTECARCSRQVGGQHGPHPAQESDHDGDVEEHVGEHDGSGRAVPRRQQREERCANDDGGEHERHGQRRQCRTPAGEAIPRQHVRRGESGCQCEHRADDRLPQSEPEHPCDAWGA
jgi:hypothetical protein